MMADSSVVFDQHVRKGGKQLKFDGKQVSIEAGAKIGSLVVINGTLKIAGEVEIEEIRVSNPRLKDGTCADGFWLAGVNGYIDSMEILNTQRDMGKIGTGTHDLTIGSFYSRAIVLEDTNFPPGHPPHRDGIQCMSGHRITIEHIDIENLIPGATNGGLWLQPNKADDEHVDQNDPTLVTDFVVEGGSIVFPNAAIHLGACTGCGARNTLLKAQRPFRTSQTTVDPVDVGNSKVEIEF
jgi:hypothetical protein